MTWALGVTFLVGLLATLLVPKEASAQGAPNEVEDTGDRTLTLANDDRWIEVRDGCVRIEAGVQRLQTGNCSDGSRAGSTEPVGENSKADKSDGDAAAPEETLKGLIERCSGQVPREVGNPSETTVVPGMAAEGTMEAEGESAVDVDLSAEQCRFVLEVVSRREPSEAGEETTVPEDAAAELSTVGDQYGDAEREATESEGDDGAPEETPETTQAAPEGTILEPVEEDDDGPPLGAPETTEEATRPEPVAESPLLEVEPAGGLYAGDGGASSEQYREEPTEAAPESPTQYTTPSDSTEPAPMSDQAELAGSTAGDDSEPATGTGDEETTLSDVYPSPALPTEDTPNGPVAVLPDTGGPPLLVLAAVLAIVAASVGLTIRRIREGR